MESGFVPYRLVRRAESNEPEKSFLKVMGHSTPESGINWQQNNGELELLARIETRPNSRGSLDRLHRESTPDSPLDSLIYDEFTHAFFVAGYGAMRRVETGDFNPGSSRKMRGARYQRVASLFEDQVALQPLDSWFQRLDQLRQSETVALMNDATPPEISFFGKHSENEDQYMFEFEGHEAPFGSLSDGYRAFIAFVGDLISRLSEVAPQGMKMKDIPGIVLVDEVDLHLHPSWQQRVIADLARPFPKLQFIFSSHSPLIVNSLDHLNIFMTEDAEDGSSTLVQLDEHVYGRTVDQLLKSSYFGLETTRPIQAQEESRATIESAIRGDKDAALDLLKQMKRKSMSRPVRSSYKK